MRMRYLITGAALLLALGAPPAQSITSVSIVASGDLALKSSSADTTVSNFALTLSPDYTLTLGDNTNDSRGVICNESPCSSLDEYAAYFTPTWGRLPGLKPSPGNHDYIANYGTDYKKFFGLTRTYYSFDVPGWHIIALDSQLKNLTTSKDWTNEQNWLKADLASAPAGSSILAYFHYPRYSVSCHHSGYTKVQKLWDILAPWPRTTLVLNGNNHTYERYAPIQTITEFEISTGGASPATLCPAGKTPQPLKTDAGYHVGQFTLNSDGTYSGNIYRVSGSPVIVDQVSG